MTYKNPRIDSEQVKPNETQERVLRFSEKYGHLPNEVVSHDLNYGLLLLFDEMATGRSAISVLRKEMGQREKDDELFTRERISKLLPHLIKEEEEQRKYETDEIERAFSYFVRLHLFHLLKEGMNQISAFRNRIESTYNRTEHIRLECIDLSYDSLSTELKKISPDDFDKVITLIKTTLRLRLDNQKKRLEEQGKES